MKKMLLFAAILLLTASCATKKNAVIGNFQHLNTRNMSNISSIHEVTKAVSAKPLFKGQEGVVNALQIQKDGLLDKHVTKVPAITRSRKARSRRRAMASRNRNRHASHPAKPSELPNIP